MKGIQRAMHGARLWERIPSKPGEEAGRGSQRDKDGLVGLADEEETVNAVEGPGCLGEHG